MSFDPQPILTFEPPRLGEREKRIHNRPKLSIPPTDRQAVRLAPQFTELRAAFDTERARLSPNMPDEVDPTLVVVFDLAGSVKNFRNAIGRIEGLEFLSELIGEQSDPDDDFYMRDPEKGRTDKPVQHSLYLTLSNAKAIEQLLNLFKKWQDNPNGKFAHGLNKFKSVFKQLISIRRWGPEDRIRETGLREQWQETLETVGQSQSTVTVEIELWYRSDAIVRAAAQKHVERIIADSGGRILDSSQIGEISYHALLAELPIQQVHSLINNGAESISLLVTEEVMFVSPFTPMSIPPPTTETRMQFNLVPQQGAPSGLPRIALLDGLPFVNHDALAGRLLVDDPDGLGEKYPLHTSYHGTAMASLIIHGDLANQGEPIDRPLYVRPILCPHPLFQGCEQTLPDRLLPDLLHRAVKRIVEGDGDRPPIAPSVRVINLSIGTQARALVSRMSPVGRLLDWLAYSYNLLFIVSAGNHLAPITIPAAGVNDPESARTAIIRAVHDSALVRGILPPGDAFNALTVGATHADGLGNIDVPDTAWDITYPNGPAYYSATGPGVDRSVKPDLHHTGGRALYLRPVIPLNAPETVAVKLANTNTLGPGVQVAAPGQAGSTNHTVFSIGTSNATALVTREASRLFDVLESSSSENSDDAPLPDAQYHPLLARALLVHASSWGDWETQLRRELSLNGKEARRHLTAILGYGRLDTERLGVAATNRALLVTGGMIARDERHTYELPLPPSLRASAEWHRITITLAYMAPTVSQINRYRSAKVYFVTPDMQLAGGKRIDADHHSVRRGSLQHEIIQGRRAMVFDEDGTYPIHVECMDDAQHFGGNKKVRYALAVSIETAEDTLTTIYEEVRARLRQRTRDRARAQVQIDVGDGRA